VQVQVQVQVQVPLPGGYYLLVHPF
jgi:hypothetical protein